MLYVHQLQIAELQGRLGFAFASIFFFLYLKNNMPVLGCASRFTSVPR